MAFIMPPIKSMASFSVGPNRSMEITIALKAKKKEVVINQMNNLNHFFCIHMTKVTPIQNYSLFGFPGFLFGPLQGMSLHIDVPDHTGDCQICQLFMDP